MNLGSFHNFVFETANVFHTIRKSLEILLCTIFLHVYTVVYLKVPPLLILLDIYAYVGSRYYQKDFNNVCLNIKFSSDIFISMV